MLALQSRVAGACSRPSSSSRVPGSCARGNARLLACRGLPALQRRQSGLEAQARSGRRAMMVQAGAHGPASACVALRPARPRLARRSIRWRASRSAPGSPHAPAAAFAPPTVADTKSKFMLAYTRPIPSIYNTVVQELLVQQHFIRYGVNYVYNPVRVPAGRFVHCLLQPLLCRRRCCAANAP